MQYQALLTRHSGFGNSLAVLLSGLALVSLAVVGLHLAGLDPVAAVRDRTLNEGPEAGSISDIGILLMALAGTSAAFGAWKMSSTPLAVLALFCLTFAIDDAFLIHERFGPWEKLVYVLYGALALLALILFWKDSAHVPWPILVATGAFAASVVIDRVWESAVTMLQLSDAQHYLAYVLYRAGYIVEDTLKFAGIVVFCSLALGETLSGRAARARETVRVGE